MVIGPDHFHANFYDAMPPFVLGVEEAEAFGDFGSRSGPLPVASALAWSIRDGLARDGFDVALSYALTVDHGIVQSYDMVRGGRPTSRWSRWSSTPPPRRCRRCPAAWRSAGRSARRSGPPLPGGCWSSPAAACRTGCRPTTRATPRSRPTGGRR